MLILWCKFSDISVIITIFANKIEFYETYRLFIHIDSPVILLM